MSIPSNHSIPEESQAHSSRTPIPTTTSQPQTVHVKTPISTFLLIPLEIRLHIYTYVLNSNPATHTHLALPPPNNPLRNQISKIPTPLLQSCTQIYLETSPLPFTHNHFRFTPWFGSGIYAARQFSRGLRPWQRDLIRNVEIEVLGRDLWDEGMRGIGGGGGGCGVDLRDSEGKGKGKVVGEWQSLCGLWIGVQRLRLHVKGPLGRLPTPIFDKSGDVVFEGKEEGGRLLSVEQFWVTDGLKRLGGLRALEVGIDDEGIGRERKWGFCKELEGVLNGNGGGDGRVRVLFIENSTVGDEKCEDENGNGDGNVNANPVASDGVSYRSRYQGWWDLGAGAGVGVGARLVRVIAFEKVIDFGVLVFWRAFGGKHLF